MRHTPMPLSHAYAVHHQSQSTHRLRRLVFAAIVISLGVLVFMSFFEVRLKIRLSSRVKRVHQIFGSEQDSPRPPVAPFVVPSPAQVPAEQSAVADIPMPTPEPASPPVAAVPDPEPSPPPPPRPKPDQSNSARLPVVPLVYDRFVGIVPTFIIDIPHWKRPHNTDSVVGEHGGLSIHRLPTPHLEFVEDRDPYDVDLTDGEFNIVVNRSPLVVRYDADMSRRKWRRILRREEVEFAVAHYLLWRKAVDEKIPMMLVLESGVRLTESDEQVRKLLSKLPNPETFDICFLQNRENYNEARLDDIDGTDGVYWRTKARVGSYGYVFTQRFAKQVYDSFLLWGPADEYIARITSVYLSTDQPNRFVALAPR
eukprot:TRINITY_DN10366_c0_g1_i1.p1 TRINITY_DN10366_c0_g1~~TRINITY_DN10366_c0_g1_i1.p1  ORF type:complete len:368 (-),score=155.23 TRINITY_DN10366_c0_g1_i1:554-1657(-)